MSPALFAHGHLRLYLLSLLDETPRHGYDLIQALSDRFGGSYVPSAGTIYPRLAKLEDEGLVTKRADGRKTVYEITDAGRAELRERSGDLDGIESELSDSARRIAVEVRASVDSAMKSLRSELAEAAREARTDARAARPDGSRGTSRSGAPGPDDRIVDHLQSRVSLRDAETLLAEFRLDVRADLRQRAARGELDEGTVAALRDGLADVRRAIAQSEKPTGR